MGPIFALTVADNLRSLRFQLSLLVLLAFFIGNGVVYSWKGDRATIEEAQILGAAESAYQSVETVADAVDRNYRIISLPTGYEFIAEAGSDWYPYAYNVRPTTAASSYFGSSRGTNSWLRPFEILDWSFIVRFVVSFLCIALVYDALSGERESGTLRLLLANPVPRAHVIVGKYAAHLVSLLAAVGVGVVVSLLIMGLAGVLELDAGVALLVFLFLLATAAYATVFLLLGLGISAATGQSATSLVVLVLLWALLLVVIPQCSRLVVLTTTTPFGGNRWELYSQTNAALEEEGLALRPMDRARAGNFDLELRYAQRYRQLDQSLQSMRHAALRHELDEYATARLVNSLSPGFAFHYTLERLTANGIHRFEHFAPQATGYLEHLRSFLRDRDEADPDSPHVRFFPTYMSQAPMDPRHIPRFSEDRLTPLESVAAAPAPLIVLALEALAALWFALWAFHRMPLADTGDGG